MPSNAYDHTAYCVRGTMWHCATGWEMCMNPLRLCSLRGKVYPSRDMWECGQGQLSQRACFNIQADTPKCWLMPAEKAEVCPLYQWNPVVQLRFQLQRDVFVLQRVPWWKWHLASCKAPLKTLGDILDSGTSVATSAWLQENQGFPLLFLYLVLFPRFTLRMFKNVFNSCHVCSVLQMDCISLPWWLYTVSSILKLWLLTILRRKLHCNWITRTVLALKSLSHQMLFFDFFNRSFRLSLL